MTKFDEFLKNSLSKRNNHNWRLGGNLYARKFRYALESGVEADNMLQRAERDLAAVRARMLELALPLHREAFPGHKDHTELSGRDRENAVIGEVLNKIADRHATRTGYLDDARKDLDEARTFVREKHLLTLPSRANLQVIPTPEFMRGSYPVGGFNAAPALEPQLGAFYWVTPIPGAWPKERVESKLREYNFYKLKLLTIHEAMPGHYVQMEIANDLQPKARRVLRSIFGNGAYIEGWGQYATQMMLDEGFLNRSPEMAPDLCQGRTARAWQRHHRCTPADAGDDRPGGARPDGETDLPGGGRGDGEIAARQTHVGSAADVLRRLARPGSRSATNTSRRRAALSAWRISTTGR